MQFLYIIVTMMVSFTHARVLHIPTAKEITKRNTHDAELMDNLSKIKSLLQKLQDIKTGSVLTTTLATTAAPLNDIIDSREPMRDKIGAEDRDETPTDSIAPEDMDMLRELKRILEDARRQHNEKIISDDKEARMDDLGDGSDVTHDVTWRDLARKLQMERDQLYIQRKQYENRPTKVKAVVGEGYFLPLEETQEDVKDEKNRPSKLKAVAGGYFLPLEKTQEDVKDEIRASVEKNLMTDLALAFHSGISVQDIIDDLTHRVNSKD